MSEATIRAKIKSILEGVSGIGVVHNRRRYSKSLAEYLKMMTSSVMINGWTIHNKSTPADIEVHPAVERHHHYEIAGIYELDDENDSYSTFRALLESISDAFDGNPTLDGLALNSGPIQIDNVDEDDLGSGRLFHNCLISIDVEERVFL